MINIMELNVNNLAKEQYNYLKEHTIKILKDIINDLENNDLKSIKRKIVFSPAGDSYGSDNYFINFSYKEKSVSDDCVMDINDIIEKMEKLKKAFEVVYDF